jgi:transcriptional regulator with XRE-family HTH domain
MSCNRMTHFEETGADTTLDQMTEAEIRKLLRDYRKARGVKQEELAERLSLSQAQVSRLERDEVGLRIDEVSKWAAVLGLEVDIVVREAGERPLILSRLETQWGQMDENVRGIIERFVLMAEKETG